MEPKTIAIVLSIILVIMVAAAWYETFPWSLAHLWQRLSAPTGPAPTLTPTSTAQPTATPGGSSGGKW